MRRKYYQCYKKQKTDGMGRGVGGGRGARRGEEVGGGVLGFHLVTSYQRGRVPSGREEGRGGGKETDSMTNHDDINGDLHSARADRYNRCGKDAVSQKLNRSWNNRPLSNGQVTVTCTDEQPSVSPFKSHHRRGQGPRGHPNTVFIPQWTVPKR